MKIRPGVIADLPAILQMERASETAPHWPESVYREALSGAGGHCVFVADDSGVRGFAVCATIADEAELENIVVAPESRRRGLGRALCEAVVASAREAGVRVVALEVRSASRGARSLYESLGFCPAGLRRGYYADPTDDALIMRLEL